MILFYKSIARDTWSHLHTSPQWHHAHPIGSYTVAAVTAAAPQLCSSWQLSQPHVLTSYHVIFFAFTSPMIAGSCAILKPWYRTLNLLACKRAAHEPFFNFFLKTGCREGLLRQIASPMSEFQNSTISCDHRTCESNKYYMIWCKYMRLRQSSAAAQLRCSCQ